MIPVTLQFKRRPQSYDSVKNYSGQYKITIYYGGVCIFTIMFKNLLRNSMYDLSHPLHPLSIFFLSPPFLPSFVFLIWNGIRRAEQSCVGPSLNDGVGLLGQVLLGRGE